ncbi:hypothetical protein Aph02nite_23310 [Actinoplanes philippinensis]|nr:hypothetical protein [Actinoplanes philippinensis]GIE76381.1 hypothetical protein Aph02nite_23310 [Actinoplanes philippinensis]
MVIGLLAIAGLGVGLLLDDVGFLADRPLTGNVVAGILGAPATVLLAVLVFERLSAAQRADAWLTERGELLRRVVTPQIDALLTTLGVTWPLEATGDFDDDLAVVVEQYAKVPQGGDPVGEDLLARTRRVAELAQRADPDGSRGPVEATIKTLDLLIHQDSAPEHAEAATDLRTIANAYAEQVTASGYAARRFTGQIAAVAFRSWTWEAEEHRLVFRTETSEWNVSAAGLSHDGFLYRQQLEQARRLAAAARRVRSLLDAA